MSDIFDTGLDEEIEDKQENTSDSKVVSIADAKKKRAPWHPWEVGGKEYHLKLTTQNILKVEKKYRTNIMNLMSVDGMPSLSVMLTILQAALLPFYHGLKSDKVAEIYDTYVSEGGGQTGLMNDVLTPTMMVSGFFTEEQAKVMEKNLGTDDLM